MWYHLFRQILGGNKVTIKKLKEIRYVVMFVAMMFLLVLCSSIVDFNYIDLIYLMFILISIVRYFIISLKNWIIS